MYKTLVSEARQRGVRLVNLDDFLAYIGYVPKRRLFLPGDPNNRFNLKAGARSASIEEPMGDRTSSGQVSGAYSRNRRLKQPSASGQTSKLFGE
jgi:hypothetical protein